MLFLFSSVAEKPVFRILYQDRDERGYADTVTSKLQDPQVCTIITVRVRPSVNLSSLVKMLISFEPHGIFGSNFA